MSFDGRLVPLSFTIESGSEDPLPGHRLSIRSVAASPYGFRINYRIEPPVQGGWSPFAEATDDAGNEWIFMGGGYGTEHDGSASFTSGELTTGPKRPAVERTYRVVIQLNDRAELVLAARLDSPVPWD